MSKRLGDKQDGPKTTRLETDSDSRLPQFDDAPCSGTARFVAKASSPNAERDVWESSGQRDMLPWRVHSNINAHEEHNSRSAGRAQDGAGMPAAGRLPVTTPNTRIANSPESQACHIGSADIEELSRQRQSAAPLKVLF